MPENKDDSEELASLRDICSWMVRVYDAANGATANFASQGQAMSGIEELANYRDLAKRAKAILEGT